MALVQDSRPPNRPDTLKIVGLGGALRPASSSRAALEVALAGAAGAGAEIEPRARFSSLTKLETVRVPVTGSVPDRCPKKEPALEIESKECIAAVSDAKSE